ncbi:cytochrome P450 [Xylaria scruposa]|nr:cytochrome P450 [Xylaria scruposa]
MTIWRLGQVGRRPSNYPPGPPTLPLIGNLHQIQAEKRHLQFQRWAQEYGPIYSLMLGTQVVIVLSSDVVIRDLVDKRSAIYSSRPEAYIAQDILSGGLRPLFMPNDDSHAGNIWKMARRLFHQILNVSAARNYIPYQDLESKAMLVGILQSPDKFIDHIRRYTASLTTQMTFGNRTTSIQDGRFKEAFDIFDRSSELIGSKTAAMLDLLPLLRRIPAFLLPVKREGQRIHRQERALYRQLYLDVKREVHDGTSKPCVTVDLIKIQEKEGFSDDIAAYISGALLQAGSETTATILIAFVKAMIMFPEVAKKAQAQLDSVCGDRLPELDDEPELPYIRACCKECLRWMPGFLLGIPHASTQDDEYLNYHIPKGSTIIINVWGVHHDSRRHPNPEKFDPLRYIDDHQSSSDSSNSLDATKRDHFVFGAGRRKCQGMHIADRSLFLAVSRMLWAFDFKATIDPKTLKEVVLDMHDIVDGMLASPEAFKADIIPRNQLRSRIVQSEWAQMLKFLNSDTLEWKIV